MPAEYIVKSELGTITIVEDVIAVVAGYAAIECIGIVAMASRKASDGFVELLGKENFKKGITVTLVENTAVINLFIVVEYGVSISAVAKTIIETVKYRVENNTGVKVSKVNVSVAGIRV